jgi:hypothetical protein
MAQRTLFTRRLLCWFFFISPCLYMQAQPACTFNVRLGPGEVNSVLNSVVPYGDEYITIGIAISDESPFFIGTEIYKFDSSGNYEVVDFILSEDRFIEAWGRESAISAQGEVCFTGYSNAGGRHLLLGVFNVDEGTTRLRTVPHDLFPEEDWYNGRGIEDLNGGKVVYGNQGRAGVENISEGMIAAVDSLLNTNTIITIEKPDPSNVNIVDVYQKINGGILVLYSETESGNFCEPYRRMHIREYDATFSEILREYSFPISQNISSQNTSLCQGADGAIYMHANELNYLDTNPNCNAAFVTDPRIYKFNDTLGLVWTADFTRPQDFEYDSGVVDIVRSGDGNFVTAFTQSIPVDTNDLVFQTALQIIKFSPEGELLFRRMYSAFGESDTVSVSNRIYDLKATPDGGFVMVGESQRRAMNFQTDTTDDFTQRGWILKVDTDGLLQPSCLDTTVSTTDFIEAGGVGAIAFPNPTSDLLNIRPQGNWKRKLSFRVIDQLGRVVFNRRDNLPYSEEVTYSIVVADLPPGIYRLLITDGERKVVRSFVKQ